MIIERDGIKFYAPDESAVVINGKWEVDPASLIPYQEWLNQQNVDEKNIKKTAIQKQIDALVYADKQVDNDALQYAVDMYNELITAEEITLQTEVDNL
jgi:cbb3-type cytochrome oxidase cytochrome c subunit